MSTLLIENVPAPLYDEIRRRAEKENCTPGEAALEMLKKGVRIVTPIRCEPPLPDEPFMTEEISAPFDIPWPKGEIVDPWGSPLRIYFAGEGILVRSAGPNKRFDDSTAVAPDDYYRSN